jgi:hypothetical protein
VDRIGERSTNLANLAEKSKSAIDSQVMMMILDTQKSGGGATVPDTIFQFIGVPAEEMRWVRVPGYSD